MSSTDPLLNTQEPPTPSDPPPAYSTTVAAPPPSLRPPRPPPPPRPPFNLPVLSHLRTKRVILASSSPRRHQLLNLLLGPHHPNLQILPSTFLEDLDKSHHTPYSYVSSTAHAKCLEVYTRLQKLSHDSTAPEDEAAVVLAADTVIVRTPTGQILEKPRNRADHVRMLMQLVEDGSHSVFTAVVAMAPREDARFPGYRVKSEVVETVVEFDKSVSKEMVEAYVDTREGVDKAGGYALQGLGGVLVKRIVGSWDNVVGLPLRETVKVLEAVVKLGEDGGTSDEEEEGEEEEE